MFAVVRNVSVVQQVVVFTLVANSYCQRIDREVQSVMCVRVIGVFAALAYSNLISYACVIDGHAAYAIQVSKNHLPHCAMTSGESPNRCTSTALISVPTA
jgi:hypothetical protein